MGYVNLQGPRVIFHFDLDKGCMMNTSKRWQQRFANLEKSYLFLLSAMQKESYTPLEISGLIKTFEFTFELSWKTLKDYLQAEGILADSPRETLKQAFQMGLIEDGHLWIEMLDKRNELTHTYDEPAARQAATTIKAKYQKGLTQLFEKLASLNQKG